MGIFLEMFMCLLTLPVAILSIRLIHVLSATVSNSYSRYFSVSASQNLGLFLTMHFDTLF